MLVLVTGFGPFLDVAQNPSGAVARALDGVRVGPAGVVGRELPVDFATAPGAVDAALAELGSRRPDLLLGLGVRRRSRGFDLERRARPALASEEPDASGRFAADLDLGASPERATRLALEPLLPLLALDGCEPPSVSEDAGGYVCERTYLHLLERAEALGVEALFLHVPRVEIARIDAQRAVVERLLGALVTDLASRAG